MPPVVLFPGLGLGVRGLRKRAHATKDCDDGNGKSELPHVVLSLRAEFAGCGLLRPSDAMVNRLIISSGLERRRTQKTAGAAGPIELTAAVSANA
jgi:hypothetical protein